MIKTNKKIGFVKFLFKTIAFIVMMVYVCDILTSSILNIVGNRIFSNMAHQYSADHIFESNYRNPENIIEIEELGGWIFLIDDAFSLKYISNEKVPRIYEFTDIVDLQNGEYEYNGVTYFGSIKKTNFDNMNAYGVVVIPTDYISSKILLTPQKQNLKSFILFFIFKIMLFFLGTTVVIFIASKLLYGRLYKPLSELRNGFLKLKEEDYPVVLHSNNEYKIIEFSFIKESFNSMSKTLEELQKERLANNKKKVQLFVDIRHDLKTPITVIKGFSEALLNNKISQNEYRRYIESINKNAVAIDMLLEELCEIIEYENYNYNLNLSVLDFCEYIRQSIIEFLPLFDQMNMEVSIDMPKYEVLVELDKNIFNRALKNLMKNIIDHNEKNTKVYFHVKIKQNKVMLIIADSGNKINEDILENIFEPFVTSDGSRSTASKNRGLGLSITKKIIELHKGKIYLEQEIEDSINKKFIIELKKIN